MSARRRSCVVVAAAVALASVLTGAALRAASPAPQRIVVVAPSAAELLFALGLGPKVVGVGEYVSWPPEARKLPKVGGLLDPRLETLVQLHPDLAVLLPSERELAERLRALHVDVLVVPHETIADVETAARAIGARAGVTAAAERFVTGFQGGLAPAPVPGKPRVLLVLERERGSLAQLLVAGPHTFLDELLGRLGAVNACGDCPLAWPQVSLEEVIARRPDVIVEIVPKAPAAADVAAVRDEWRRAPGMATHAPRVEIVGGDFALVPGPRLPLLYAALRRALLATPRAP